MTLVHVALIAVLGGYGLTAAFLYINSKKPTAPPAPAPREPSINVLARTIATAITDTVVATNRETAQAMGRAIGDAVASALAPSPTVVAQDALQRVQHGLSELAAEIDVDDTDPYDHVVPRGREDVVFVGRDEPAPFGVPGVGFPADAGL